MKFFSMVLYLVLFCALYYVAIQILLHALGDVEKGFPSTFILKCNAVLKQCYKIHTKLFCDLFLLVP